MKKQTAIEWLQTEREKNDMDILVLELWQQAREIEKQQIIQAYKDAFNNNEIDISFDVLNRISNYYWDEKYAK
jgi:hypothetical protein